jgi:acetylornithine deacetylase
MSTELRQRIQDAVDTDRLVATASDLVAIPSPTGSELEVAVYLRGAMQSAGLDSVLQHVEEGRANAVGRLPGAGEGPSLMFNGHLDTSYSGEESWLTGHGYKPEPVIVDGAVVGLGIMNMKGAVACYLEAIRALQDAGARLSGDVVIAGVCGEIEKAQWGAEFSGSDYRGYGYGTRHLVVHGVLADGCILGEPTEERVALGHWGSAWARISTTGSFKHTAFSEGELDENSIIRMQEVIEAVRPWITDWEERSTYKGRRGLVGVGAVRGGFPWRLSRTPQRTDLFLDIRVPPTISMVETDREFRELLRSLMTTFPDYGIEGELFVTAPGSEIAPDHRLVQSVVRGHEQVYGRPPEFDYVRWGSDAGTLSRYGVPSLNYGPIASGLPGPEGESVPIESLINIARSYALAAVDFCGVEQ